MLHRKMRELLLGLKDNMSSLLHIYNFISVSKTQQNTKCDQLDCAVYFQAIYSGGNKWLLGK